MKEVENGSFDEMVRETGCVFPDRRRGVICKNRDNCDKCGWNTEVEEARKRKIREERLREEV